MDEIRRGAASEKVDTTRKAKAAFRRRGMIPVSDSELRRLHHEVEHDKRAEKLRQAESRRKVAAQRKREREQQRQEELARAGIGRATQFVGFSRSQRAMKKGMESFLGFSKATKDRTGEDDRVPSICADHNSGDCNPVKMEQTKHLTAENHTRTSVNRVEQSRRINNTCSSFDAYFDPCVDDAALLDELQHFESNPPACNKYTADTPRITDTRAHTPVVYSHAGTIASSKELEFDNSGTVKTPDPAAWNVTNSFFMSSSQIYHEINDDPSCPRLNSAP